LRIKNHPILTFDTKEDVPFTFNKKPLYGTKEDCIASALHANRVKTFTTSLRYNRSRGFFCGIGKCSSCLMRVNGVPNVRTCIAPLRPHINVETQDKLGAWPNAPFQGTPQTTIEVDILIVGAGPAGLCASIEAAKQGASVLLVDENQKVGGQLIKQTHKFFGSRQERAGTRGIDIAKELEGELQELETKGRATLLLDSTVFGFYEAQSSGFTFGVAKREQYLSTLVKVTCQSVIFACGAMENMLLFPGNDLPGVYGAGAVQTLMNVYGVQPGKKVLMVGAGNVGLIVSYQLLQAGIQVDRVVEAAPTIGGYHVHAAKLRRCGVPIYTSHSIKEVYGKDKVEGAVIVRLDENWQPVAASEETISCDTVCLAVGLTPSTRMLAQMNTPTEEIPEAGGSVALHDDTMMTAKDNVYVAGDSSGIEEASTAMIEGKIAGISAAFSLGYNQQAKELRHKYERQLQGLRAGPFGEKPRIAKRNIHRLMRKINVQL
jgi:sarcosine oxidase subunit alpha